MEKLLGLLGFPSPAILLGVVCVVLLSLVGGIGGGAYLGYQYRDGKVAGEALAAANTAANRARQDAAAESAEALAQARKAEATRQASAAKKHQLELELARDETARNCRVSDGTFRVLLESINSANGAAPEAGSVDAAVSGVPVAGQPVSGGLGTRLDEWLRGIQFLPSGKASLGRVD